MRKLLVNPMFYKDTTQLVRHKSFPAIMIMLFAVTLLAALPLLMAEEESAATGFITLFVTLGIFGLFSLVILSLQSTMNTQEIINKSAEMYELTGMSVESITIGKMASICAQLLFGFSCLLPLLVTSYFLGGVDLWMIVCLLLGIVVAIPLFAVVVIAASSSVSGQVKPGLAQGVNGLIILAIIPLAGFITALGFGLFNAIRYEPMVAVFGGGMALLLTLCVIAFAFYYTCHMLCRFYDSREAHVKAVYAITIISIMIVMPLLELPQAVGRILHQMAQYAAVITLIMVGVYFYVQPITIPKATVVRDQSLGRFSRAWRWFFRHGPAGTLRTLILVALSIITSAAVGDYFYYLSPASSAAYANQQQIFQMDKLIVFITQAGFYIAIIELVCRYAVDRKKMQRHLPLVMLIFMNIMGVIFGNIFQAMYTHKAVVKEIIAFVSGLFSPFAVATPDIGSNTYSDWNYLYLITGGCGWLFIIMRSFTLRARQDKYIASVLHSVHQEVKPLPSINIEPTSPPAIASGEPDTPAQA